MTPSIALRRLTACWLLALLALLLQPAPADQTTPAPRSDDAAVAEAFRAQRSDIMVELAGQVSRLLKDDLKGSRHQRFILRLANGHSVLISHNIDLAPRIPLKKGDAVSVRGQYEWNDKGGVVHWTHHDPRGKREGGWVRHEGEMYR